MMKTDGELLQDVLAELMWEPSVGANDIAVAVKDGAVTLTGHVDSYAAQWAAERAVKRVKGVQALTMALKVTLPETSHRKDEHIANAITNALDWMTVVPSAAIAVTVESGWVTLNGTVDWDYQRQAAERTVRYFTGVIGVSNQITLTPSGTSRNTIKADIEAALHRRITLDAQHVVVTVNGSEATLSGTVHSWLERGLATHAAWGTSGVRNVIDNIIVESDSVLWAPG